MYMYEIQDIDSFKVKKVLVSKYIANGQDGIWATTR